MADLSGQVIKNYLFERGYFPKLRFVFTKFMPFENLVRIFALKILIGVLYVGCQHLSMEKIKSNAQISMNPILTYSSLAILGCIWILLEFQLLFW